MPNFSGLNPPTIRPKYRDQPMGDESGDSTGPSRGGPSRKIKRVNTKRKGELSEAAFLLKAAGLGFGVAKPWGDSERYDFILDSHCPDSHNHDSHNNDSRNHAVDRRLWRVQLKCTEVVRARGYDVQPIYSIYGQGKMVYTADDIDVLVAHIIPLDIWYVLPIEAFAPCKSLRFYPQGGCKRPRFEHYREAWHLLRSDHQQ